MLRKQGERMAALEQQKIALDTAHQNRLEDIERQKANDAFILGGGVRGAPRTPPTPGSPGASATIAPTAEQVTPQNPIMRVMQPPPSASTGLAPSTFATSQPAAPTPTPLTVTAPATPGQPGTPATSDRYDPTNDRAYQRTLQSKAMQTQAMRDIAAGRNQNRLTLADVNNSSRETRDATLQQYKQQNLETAGQIKDRVDAHIAGLRADLKANESLSPTKQVAAQRYVFDQIGKQAQGDPDEAANILNGDGALAKTAKSLGIGEDEVRRAAAAFGTKANDATDKEVLGVMLNDASGKTTATTARTKVIGAKTPPVAPSGAGPTGATGPITTTPTGRTGPPRLGAPKATTKPPTNPNGIDFTKPAGSQQDTGISDADLWEQAVQNGMPKDSATAYVKARKPSGT